MTAPFDLDDHRAIAAHFLDILAARVEIRGVVHVGVHKGQEVAEYLRRDIRNILLVEANPDWCRYLEDAYGTTAGIQVLNYAVVDRDADIDLQVHTSRSGSDESASVLPLKRFGEIVTTLHTPRTVRVPGIRLDTLFENHRLSLEDFNLLNIDIQGAEMLAFRGAPRALDHMDAVLTEVNLIEMYAGCGTEAEIAGHLRSHGLEPSTQLDHELYDATSRFPAWREQLFVRPGHSR